MLFLPGLICKLTIQIFTYFEKKGPFYFVIQSIILGFLCYLTTDLIFMILEFITGSDLFDNFLTRQLINPNASINVIGISIVSLLSVPIGLLISFVINRKYAHRFANWMKITNQFGDADVWSFSFNATEPTEWVIVRDIKYGLAYYGWVRAYSDTHRENELLLNDVIVYNRGGALQSSSSIYCTR